MVIKGIRVHPVLEELVTRTARLDFERARLASGVKFAPAFSESDKKEGVKRPTILFVDPWQQGTRTRVPIVVNVQLNA